MSVIPNASRLCLTGLVVKDSMVNQGTAEFKGPVKFGPAASLTIQAPLKMDNVEEGTVDSGVTVDGVLLKDNNVCAEDVLCVNVRAKSEGSGVCFPDNLLVDQIGEKTLNAGVSVDGVLLKDGAVHTDLLLAKTAAGICIENKNAVQVRVPFASVSASGPHNLLMDNVLWGPSTMFSAASEGSPAKINILKTGVYRVYIDLAWDAHSGSWNKLIMCLEGAPLSPGAPVEVKVVCNPAASMNWSTQSLSFDSKLYAGQSISFKVDHGDATPVNINDYDSSAVTVQYMHEAEIVVG